MATRMQQRRGTDSQWTTANPVLGPGEIGFDTTNNRFKIGDGVNTWADLNYFVDETSISGSLSDYVEVSLLGEPNGVATLDGSGKVPSAQLPDIGELSQDAVNQALTAGTGVTKTYDDAANTLTLEVDTTVIATKAYVDDEIAAIPAPDYTGLATETYVDNGLATKADSVHTHAISDVTGLQTELDSKLESSDLTGYATETYVNAAVSNLVDSAPSTLDTLNELAAALGDDPNYATTITTALGNKQDKVTGVSDTEIGYLDGVTSSIQTQLDGKAATSHTHTIADVTGLQTALNGKQTAQVSQAVSTNITAVSNAKYFVNTSAARTITLPDSPSLGDEIQIFDASGTAGTNNITVNNNGNKINGVTDTALLDANGVAAVFVWTGTTYGWRMG